MKKPLIGITLDNYDPKDNPDAAWYSKYYWYALRAHYTDSVAQAGGIPIPLPHNLDLVHDYADMIDGLLITGGGFDVPPSYYGEESLHPSMRLKPLRSQFEKAIAEKIQSQDKPILGICGGMQLLHVLYGGTLIQHIPDHAKFQEHSQKIDASQPWHDIEIVENTKLYGIVQQSSLSVNSVHHQGAGMIPDSLVVSAYAPDGMVEAIEDPKKPFVMGIQWHPEFHLQHGDTAIFDAFIGACCAIK